MGLTPSLRVCNRKGKAEGAPLSRLALNPDLPSVRLHQHLGNIQPQPQPLSLPGPLDPIKPLEEVWQLIRRDTDALVGHRYLQVAIYPLCAHHYISFWRRVFQGVAEQVGDDTLQSVRVRLRWRDSGIFKFTRFTSSTFAVVSNRLETRTLDPPTVFERQLIALEPDGVHEILDHRSFGVRHYGLGAFASLPVSYGCSQALNQLCLP